MKNKKTKNIKENNNNNFDNNNENNCNNDNNNNDFWDDSNVLLESNEKYFNDNEKDFFNKIKTKQKEKLYKKYNYLIKKYDENENISKIKQKNEKLKLINKKKCDELYENAKKLQKIKIKKFQENNIIQNINELKECTFYPNIKRIITNVNENNNNNNNIVNTKFSNDDIYERNKKWLILKQENLIKVKRKYSQKSNKNFNYTPEINSLNEKKYENIFNEENNIINQPENYFFLIRQINCRNKIKNFNNENLNIKNNYLKHSHYSNKIYHKISNNNINNIKLQLHNEILNF